MSGSDTEGASEAPAPALDGPLGAIPQRSLRETLRLSVLEGGVAELWAVLTTGAVLTAWALYAGAGPFAIAGLQAIGTGGQILHGPAGFITSRFGRRRVALFALPAARLVWLPLAFAAFAGVSTSTLLLLLFAVTAVSSALQVLGTNAWSVWLGDVVPTRFRGRFFGARNAFATGGAAAASLAAALLLDGGEQSRPIALPLLGVLLAASGIWSARLLLKHAERTNVADAPPSVDVYLQALADPRARRLLIYQLIWGFAIAPGVAFFSLHVLDDLGGSFALLAGHAVIMALVRVATAPLWGRAVDRFGPRPVLVVSSAAVATTPLLWIWCGPDFLWPLLLDAVIAGFVWGGHAIASFDLPLEVAPRPKRAYYLALFAMATGLGFIASSLLSGWAASVLPARWHGLSNLELIFVASSALRLSSSVVAAKIPSERSTATRAMMREVLKRRSGAHRA